MSDITLIALPLDRVHVGPRLRAVDDDYVALLAASMAETGQHTPVDVGPADAEGRHPLIAGAHRHAAATEAGLPTLLCRVFEGSALEAQLLEVDENLLRRELSELDRAVFLEKRKALYEQIYPETRHGGDRRSKQTAEDFRLHPRQESFAAATARKLGVTDRQVRTYIARARIFQRAPELRDPLARSRWADNGAVLDELARVEDAATLRRLVQALLREALPVPSIRAAQLELGLIKAPVASADEQQASKLLSRWRKVSKRARDIVLGELLADRATRTAIEQMLAARETAQDRVLRALPTEEAA